MRFDTISNQFTTIPTQFDFFEMSMPNDFAMPTYVIYRETQPGQPFDPAAQLGFWPAKGSDELFDALRVKYPQYGSHAERMRQAVIEFLMEEQSMQTEQLPTPQTANSTMTSPWQASMQSMSSDTSTWSSPELFDLATPSFGNSPQPQAIPLSRQQSTATSTANTTNSTPPAIEQMTGVFSLSDAAQPKQRVRRKMTEAEKVEYRKRRIVKACDKCSKRKRKCVHNQPEMENVGSSNKVTKPTPTASSKKPPPAAPPLIQQDSGIFDASNMDFGDSFGSEVSMPSLADYSTVFEPDMDLDNLLMPIEQQWPWTNDQDFTLMDSSTEGLNSANMTPEPVMNAARARQFNHSMPAHANNDHFDSFGYDWSPIEDTSLPYDQGLERADGGEPDSRAHGRDLKMFNHDMMQITGGGSQHKMLWEHLRTGQEDKKTERQQPTHTAHVHDADSKNAFVFDEDNIPSLSSGRGDDWEQGQTFALDQRNPQSAQADSGSRGRYASLSQMTLRLTGTQKAVKAFGSLLPMSSSRKKRLQNVSVKKIALLAIGGLSVAQGLPSQGANGLSRFVCNSPSCGAGRQYAMSSSLEKHMRYGCQQHPQDQMSESFKRRWVIQEADLNFNRSWPGMDTSPVEGMRIGDYLRMKTNVSPLQEDGREAVRAAPDIPRDPGASSIASASAEALTNVERSATSKDLNLKPDSGSSEATVVAPRDSAAQQGRPQTPSLGEGLNISTSPSTELYRLKRRIPRALHSVVDRTNATPATALGPLLETIPAAGKVDTCRAGDHEREIILSRNTECTGGNAILTEGGAYPTSESANSNTSPDGLGLIRVQNTALPVHTRPRDSTASGFAGDTDDYHGMGAAASAIGVNAARVPTPTNADLETAESVARAVRFGFAETAALANENPVRTERLSDHHRCRDHFGRPGLSIFAAVLYSIAAFATCLTLLAFASTTPSTLSLLVLALVYPMQEGKSSNAFQGIFARGWDLCIDIIERSSWYTALLSGSGKYNVPYGVYLQRQMYRGCESDWRRAGERVLASRRVVV